MENMHTLEPWNDDERGHCVITDRLGRTVATANSQEDSRRIVACVNACAGIPTEMLEEIGIPSIAQHMKLEKQRDELQEEVNALKERAEYDLAEFARTLDISYAEINLLKKQRDELLAALEKMNRAYVNLMENGRDRIIMLGGDCDPVDAMERSDQTLQESRSAIASVEGGAA